VDTPPASRTPVFTDESGRRASVFQWVARGVCACFVLVAGAVAFTLTTQVPLPGLDRILSPGAGPDASQTARDSARVGRSTLGAGLTAGSTDEIASGRTAVSLAAGVARPGVTRTASQVVGGPARPQQTTAAAPAADPTTSPPATANPDASAHNANANPHAAAKSSNSSVRATPGTTKTPNPQAVAARAKPKPSQGLTPASPGSKK